MIAEHRTLAHVEAEIQALLTQIQQISQDLAVLLVICVRDVTVIKRDYSRYSMSAGFLHGPEIREFVSSLASRNFYVQHFADESTFMSWILGGEQNFLPYRHKIVYTSAANGIGPGRRTLIPAFCSLEGLPTANSDAYSCAINRHKFHCAMLLKELGFRVPRTWWYDAEEGWFQDDRPTIGDRVIAKSTFEGASLGVSAATVGEFGAHMEREIANASRDLRQPMTVQEFIRGNELEVPVLRLPDRYIAPSPVAIARRGGGRSPDDVLLYEDVYDDYYEFSSPGYSNEESRRISEIAERVAAALGFRGFSRVDFRIDEFGNPFVIDVSTTPHLTRTSSFNFIFDQMGFTYSDMLEAMIAVGAKQNDMI